MYVRYTLLWLLEFDSVTGCFCEQFLASSEPFSAPIDEQHHASISQVTATKIEAVPSAANFCFVCSCYVLGCVWLLHAAGPVLAGN